jgi:arsenite methyltransferase
MRDKPDYGVDAPGVIRNLFLAAIAIFIAAMVFPRLRVGSVVFLLRPMAWNTAPWFALGALLMLIYAKWGKFRHRDRMLSLISWAGSETVLDVGTGRGLLMIGAAKRLSTGRSVGIDIWSGKDLSGNTPENTQRNALLEGVGETNPKQLAVADGWADHVKSSPDNAPVADLPTAAPVVRSAAPVFPTCVRTASAAVG